MVRQGYCSSVFGDLRIFFHYYTEDIRKAYINFKISKNKLIENYDKKYLSKRMRKNTNNFGDRFCFK